MRDDLLIQQLNDALREWGALPPQERVDEMVRRGVIDKKGRVLLRMPEPPGTKRKKKKTGDDGKK
jgi:hypothetical protein